MIQREIQKKWSVIPQRNSPIHKQNLVLPPEKWEDFDPFFDYGQCKTSVFLWRLFILP